MNRAERIVVNIFAAAILSASLPLFLGAESAKVLRVGISPTDPPIAYWERNKVTGLEAEFSEKLGEALGCKVELVDLPFGKLIPALLSSDIDIIMAGMSVTPIRSLQISFSTPYMKVGQMALVRREDRAEFANPSDIVMSHKTAGAQENTTGQFLLVQEFQNAQKRFFPTPEKGAEALRHKEIDLLILDSPYVLWLARKNEGTLTPIPALLTEENLAWGVRKTDVKLLTAANEALEKWKASGELETMIRKWVPDSN